MDKKLVAVVILGWNGKKYLEQFLPSVIKYSTHPDVDIYYADNQSTDESVAFVKNNFPSVKIIQNKQNNGYAGGYNDALEQVNSDYFILLNQDVEVSENWIFPVIEKMETNHLYAAAQPKIKSFAQKNAYEYAGAAGGYMDFLGFAFCKGRIFDSVENDTGQFEEEADIFWASGACLFVRADVYWQAGGLDEDFFAHQEEIDLCWRIHNLGFKIYYQPKSAIYHVGGGSLPQGNPRKTYLNFRNNLFLLLKNLPFSELIWKLPIRLALDGLAAWQSVVKHKNFKDWMAIAKAHIHFVTNFPSMFSKRKLTIQQNQHLLYRNSIVFQYFLLNKKTYLKLRK